MCGESPEESRPAGPHAAPRKRGAGTRQGGGLIWGLRLCEVGAQGTHVMGVEHRLERKLAAPWGWEAPGKASSAVRAGARDPALPGLLSSSLPSHNDPGKVHALVPRYRGRNGGRAAVASSPPLLCSWWPQVRAGESLMKLVSDLKQFLILNDFPSVNEAIDQRNQQLRALQEECDRKLIALRDEISIDLYELEEEYYSSSSSLCEANDLPLCEAYWRLDLDTDSADGLSAPVLASPEPSAGPLQAAAPAHSHATGPGPTEHA
ncbi:mediator of RNA polymerase II transcription subunit 22 isoform X1 [Panthera leo]|uniref:mediator of RNA polymerase II transcription subunit 22 isoform X1 n=1 Tax=Panthera leo TaxID=9689 RepID=UPI001C69A393|nr:mediator of RNA polymerase II transcription subunit 22 isoform X1 [Panthera leo]